MSYATPAILQGGPLAGFADTVRLPLPHLVTVRFCPDCEREHLHQVLGFDVPVPFWQPRYLLDLDATLLAAGNAVYRFLDVGQELALLPELAGEPLA